VLRRAPSLFALPFVALLAQPVLVHADGAGDLPAADRAAFDPLVARVAASYDSAHGGFVDHSGVPSTSAIQLAFVLDDEDWKVRGLATTEWMMATLRDTVGGGYLNSERDQEASSGAMSKPTDSNARRLELFLALEQETGNPVFRHEAARVADYMDRVLLDGRGGFVSGQGGDRDLVGDANGVAIHAWLEWAVAKGDRGTRDFALKSLDTVWERCQMDGPLVRRGTFGDLLSHPLLADQVEMGRAFVLANQLAGRARDRERAVAMGDLVLARFEIQDKKNGRGGFHTHADMNDKGEAKGDGRDADVNARAILFLAELSHLTGDARYADAARRAVAVFAPKFEKLDVGAADWALAVRALSVNDAPEAPEWMEQTGPAKPAVRPRAKRYHTLAGR
jgi:uncharacterized protein YyaL (SSP411 family)